VALGVCGGGGFRVAHLVVPARPFVGVAIGYRFPPTHYPLPSPSTTHPHTTPHAPDTTPSQTASLGLAILAGVLGIAANSVDTWVKLETENAQPVLGVQYGLYRRCGGLESELEMSDCCSKSVYPLVSCVSWVGVTAVGHTGSRRRVVGCNCQEVVPPPPPPPPLPPSSPRVSRCSHPGGVLQYPWLPQ
jgi:hypothetical protein